MRQLLFALSLAFVLPAAARPDEVSDLKDKALKAAAKDPADLKKFRAHTMKARGISKLAPEPTAATFELAAVWPGQFRAAWEFGPPGGAKNGITLIASDDKGWERRIGLAAAELPVEKLNDLRSDAYAYWVSTLVTLNDAETRLAAGGAGKVGDDPVVGLKVSRRAYPDVTLFFDEKSGVLRKMAYRSRDAGVTSNKEMVYDGHKETAGLTVPTRQTTLVQGREIYSWTAMEYDFPAKIDPKTFEKP